MKNGNRIRLTEDVDMMSTCGPFIPSGSLGTITVVHRDKTVGVKWDEYGDYRVWGDTSKLELATVKSYVDVLIRCVVEHSPDDDPGDIICAMDYSIDGASETDMRETTTVGTVHPEYGSLVPLAVCEVCKYDENTVGPMSSNEAHQSICDDCLGQ